MLEKPAVRLLAAAWLVAAVAAPVSITSATSTEARAFKVRLLLDNQRLRPDTSQPFDIESAPVIDGDYVVFSTMDCCSVDAVWSINIKTKQIVKLAGTDTPVPHGQGTFENFNFTAPTVGGELVAFSANNGNGIYTVPTKGGRIHRVIASRMKSPEGDRFENFYGVSLNGAQVAFSALTDHGHHGIYQASVTGDGLVVLANEKDKLATRKRCSFEPGSRLFNFDNPVIGANVVAYNATGSGQPNNDPSGVASAGILIADNLTRLPQDFADCPHLEFGRLSAPVQSDQVAFSALDVDAHDPNTGIAFQGIFIANGADKKATRLVTNAMKSPVNRQPFGVFSGFGFDQSGLAFTATELLGGQGVFFLAGPGDNIVNIAHDTDFHSPVVGDRSVSGGVVTFASNPTTGSGNSIWVATPVTP